MVKTALIHDWLYEIGGGEKVLESIWNLYPDAPIYTTVCNPDGILPSMKKADIRTSFLQKSLNRKKDNRMSLFPYMPMAFESFDLNEFDIVLSVTGSCAKGVITKPDTMHICYCNSPMRYAWEFHYLYAKKLGVVKRKFVKYFINYVRLWDLASANRVDYYIANSINVAKRIWKHFRRESTVIYPPVNVDYYEPANIDEDYFFCVSRFEPYKRIDIAVEAFNELGYPLIVIGKGPELERLKSMAKPNVKLLGFQSDEVIREHFSRCRAFIFPGEEDFGITPVEAQASGRPVIAFGKGGALETVKDGETGLFFDEQSTGSLIDAVKRFEGIEFSKEKCRLNAERFSVQRFESEIKSFIEKKHLEFKEERHWEIFE